MRMLQAVLGGNFIKEISIEEKAFHIPLLIFYGV
jgi:hypothetical protein